MKTIKGKLILSFSIVFLIVSLFLGFYYFDINYRNQKKELKQSTYTNLQYFQSNINRILERCSMLSDKIYFNRNIAKILLRDYNVSGNQNLDRDLSDALGDISGYLSNDIISSYATGIIIYGQNGQMIKYGPDADYFKLSDFENESWFLENKSNNSVKWLPIIENTTGKTISRYYIPLLRKCISTDGRKEIGWQLIIVTTDLVRDAIKDYNFRDGEILVIYDRNQECVYSNKSDMTKEELHKILAKYDSDGFLQYAGERWYAAQDYSDYSDLTILQLVNYNYFRSQIKTLFQSSFLALFISLTVAVSMTILLSNTLTRPLQRIMQKMELISEGDFSVDHSLNGDDEIGNLGKGINSLAQSVETLMIRVREEERQKKEYEYKILQSQINPHFVYNVLNSIRIMANLQGAANISNIIENFGGLLKEVSKGVDDKVTVKKEFELTEKYTYLQNLRRKGLLHVQYEIDSECEDYLILKFLLQPLIENSVLHGLEEKKGPGRIRVHAFRKENTLCITIWDNGEGMSKEEIQRLMNLEEKQTIGQYNKVGVRNVQERIQLLYGPEYGLKYESIKGEYTQVTVILPLEK